MFKKYSQFLLMLGLSVFTFSTSTVALGEENQEKVSTISQGISSGDHYSPPKEPSKKVDIPDKLPKVRLPDSPAGFQRDQSVETEDAKRYTVLVLDTSSSSDFISGGKIFYTANTALGDVKIASKKFIEDVQKAEGENYIAIVEYKGDSSSIVSPFSTDARKLSSAIDKLTASQNIRSIGKGLTAADRLFDSISANSNKNVVLFTTGMSNSGGYSYDGHYDKNTIGSDWYRTDTNIRLYAYANASYAAAKELKSKSTIYSIGLFQTLADMPARGQEIVQFFKLSALDIASSTNHFYDVKDPNELEFVFGKVADSITKNTGSFKYLGNGTRDKTATYYYDDAYFQKSSYVYNEHLATMSLCLELSSWASGEVGNDYSKKMKNAKNLLSGIGFKDFSHNYTDFAHRGIVGKPTKDSIGVVAANKEIKVDGGDQYTLLALAVRGGGYESEWASNSQ